MDWLPPQINALSLWTELVEFCDWDEEAAALLIEQVRADLPPHPPAHIKQIAKQFVKEMERQPKEVTPAEA